MKLRKIHTLNKKGTDYASFIYAIVTIFIIGIMFLLFSHMSGQIYDTFGDFLNTNPRFVGQEQANETLTKIRGFEQSMWDYAFLAIIMGYIVVMIVLSFSTQINPWFYPLFLMLSLLGLFVGVAMSNLWEGMAETTSLSDTITRFPITDAILNNFFPLFIAIMFFLIVIMLFGKRFLGTSEEGIR